MAVKIIADSTCDLSQELIEKYDIEIIPLTVTLGITSGYDGVDITPEDIYEFVGKTGELSKTSAVNVGEYIEAFKAWRMRGYDIVSFSISSGFSSSFQSAVTAAEAVGGVYPVDTRNLSTGEALVILKAAEMAKNGASPAEIVQKCEELIPKVEASFVVDSIEYLHKGGRCSSVAALGANLFKIKPAIEVIDGGMQAGKKYRGNINKAITTYVEDRLGGRDDIDMSRIFITHTRCDQSEVDKVRELIYQYCPDMQEVLETVAGATITTHCGPGTLGILFLRK